MSDLCRITEQKEKRLRQCLTTKGLEHPSFAVVLPIIRETGEILIEVRAAGISQAGDPCFPGGKIEADETPAEAAARELGEELGIWTDPSSYLGQLPTVLTYLGSRTDVFVCLISQQEADNLQSNPTEVSRVLRVPISFFLKHPNAGSYQIDGHVIWGMTAGAIRHLCDAWLRAV